ncbi:MAG: malectin domain-containing carbohydrate-binding protein [Terriglobia bacterium]
MLVRTQAEIERTELETVLASQIFARSPNVAKMLWYIGMKHLEGQEDAIKEYNIGVEAFGRPPDFDPKEDSIVRVEAHRLRHKLRQYYESEGADHAVVISLQVGHYIPQFLLRSEEHGASAIPLPSGGLLRPPGTGGGTPESSSGAPQLELPDREGPMATADSAGTAARPPIRSPARGMKWRLALALIVAAAGVAILAVKRAARPKVGQGAPAATAVPVPLATASMSAAASAGSAVRIIAGYSMKDYVGRSGETWGPDRYYSGGQAIVEPQVLIERAEDPNLFETAREGEFSYNIPLKPGTYELRLYFVETYYGPGTHAGGGETSRLFAINLNGKRLLTDFDIYGDAGGNDIADVRVFKDVSPADDGQLHLSFVKALDAPVLNALEIIPTPLGKILPIRIVCQENSYTDSAGHLWKPDRYFLRGRLAGDPTPVQGTPDPGLYAEERYGNFSYALPVAEGSYAVTLLFDETYFGPGDPGKGGVESRVFDVDCNGVALLRNFDIFKEAGGDNRALVRTFHDLRPNAQGKLLLSFVPVKNYASVRAIEVTNESR